MSRTRIAEEIVTVCRRLYDRGLIAGQDGNVSVRLDSGHILVTPSGLSKVDVTPESLVERMSCAPARLFKLPGGTLRKRAIGDVTVFDPDAVWTVDPSRFASKGRNTPYAGRELRGLIEVTVVDGRVIHRRSS